MGEEIYRATWVANVPQLRKGPFKGVNYIRGKDFIDAYHSARLDVADAWNIKTGDIEVLSLSVVYGGGEGDEE